MARAARTKTTAPAVAPAADPVPAAGEKPPVANEVSEKPEQPDGSAGAAPSPAQHIAADLVGDAREFVDTAPHRAPPVVTVTALQSKRWRIKREFGPEPVTMLLADLQEGELAALMADPLLRVVIDPPYAAI